MVSKKEIKVLGNNGGIIAENQMLFQELREIKNEVKEVKKFLIINSLHRLVENYDQQERNKKRK
jgi:adenylosuccinate synthase